MRIVILRRGWLPAVLFVLSLPHLSVAPAAAMALEGRVLAGEAPPPAVHVVQSDRTGVVLEILPPYPGLEAATGLPGYQ